MIYGKTKQEYAPMWHIIKNDGRALCKPSLKVVETIKTTPARLCNHCKRGSLLRHNERFLVETCLDGDGI
jgi:hypothetical protein